LLLLLSAEVKKNKKEGSSCEPLTNEEKGEIIPEEEEETGESSQRETFRPEIKSYNWTSSDHISPSSDSFPYISNSGALMSIRKA
jgi:hypothetical protein